MGYTNSLMLIKNNTNFLKIINRRLYVNRLLSTTRHLNSVKNEDIENKPLPFLRSSAATLQTHRVTVSYDQQPWYQPYVVLASTSIFLIYFCILREENDVDLKLSKSLYDHIDGLEEQQIEIRIKYNIENNLDTKDLEARLIELKTLKANTLKVNENNN